VSPYLRTVKTSSGATAVQIVHSSHRGSRDIEHLGSAHTAAEVELLRAAGRQKLAAGQGELDLGLPAGAPGGPLPITASRMGCLLDALAHAYDVLGFPAATGGDAVFRDLVMARIIEPASKLDSLRVLEEAGLVPPPYRTVMRRLRAFARQSWRQQVSAACAAHARLGPASLVLYDCPALYFETDAGDGFREPGFSKERRLEPQITIPELGQLVRTMGGGGAVEGIAKGFIQNAQFPDLHRSVGYCHRSGIYPPGVPTCLRPQI
jgi:hypothetical protein